MSLLYEQPWRYNGKLKRPRISEDTFQRLGFVVVVVAFLSWTFTGYVHPHLYMYKCRYTAQGERLACAIVFNDPALQAAELRLRRVLSPFTENGVWFVRELTMAADNPHTTRHKQFFTVASAFWLASTIVIVVAFDRGDQRLSNIWGPVTGVIFKNIFLIYNISRVWQKRLGNWPLINNNKSLNENEHHSVAITAGTRYRPGRVTPLSTVVFALTSGIAIFQLRDTCLRGKVDRFLGRGICLVSKSIPSARLSGGSSVLKTKHYRESREVFLYVNISLYLGSDR